MPKYIFRLKDGQLEDSVFELPDDAAAVDEGLKTASGMLHDLELSTVGKSSQSLEIKEGGETIFQIEIHTNRAR